MKNRLTASIESIMLKIMILIKTIMNCGVPNVLLDMYNVHTNSLLVVHYILMTTLYTEEEIVSEYAFFFITPARTNPWQNPAAGAT